MKIYVHKAVFVVRDVMVEAFKFAIALGLLLVILFTLGATHVNVPCLLFVIFDALLLCLALAPWLAMAGAVMTDLNRITSYIFRMLFFVSGIFFPLSRVPPDWQDIFLLNPLALLMHEARTALIGTGYDPEPGRLLGLAIISLLVGAAGYGYLHRVNRHIPKFIL